MQQSLTLIHACTSCGTHDFIDFIIAFADCFFRLNELHFALSDYQQALEMDSSDWSVRCRLSIVYNEFGILEYYDRHYLEAIDHLTTCIRYNPRIGAYYLSRARARYMIEVRVSCRIGNSDTSLSSRETRWSSTLITYLYSL